MWGLLVHGEGVREPIVAIGDQMPCGASELQVNCLRNGQMGPVSECTWWVDEHSDIFGFSHFYSELRNEALPIPADESAFAAVRSAVEDALSPVDGVVIWGNAQWMTRLVSMCAREMGKGVLYVEQGWFRDEDGCPTHIVDPVGIYTQGECLIDREWEAHSVDAARARRFVEAFKSSRQTKHQLTLIARAKIAAKRLIGGRYQPSVPISQVRREIAARGAKCLFVAGQVAEDSAQYWGEHLCSNVEDLCEQALANAPADWLVVCKPHPFDFHFAAPAARRFARHERCLWAPDGDIHDLIELADAVLTINSNVGLEASIYEKPVFTAGSAVYGNRGFTTQLSQFEELTALLDDSPEPNHNALLKFLDYVTSVYLIRRGDSATAELERRMVLSSESA